MTKIELIAALADARDRLSDQADGLRLARDAGCSPIALLALLVPVAGTLIATAARLACATLTTGQIDGRISRLDRLIVDVEALAGVVSAATPATLPEVERRVRVLISALEQIDASAELADAALDGASGLVADVRSGLGAVGTVLGVLFSPTALLAVGLGYLWFSSRRSKS